MKPNTAKAQEILLAGLSSEDRAALEQTLDYLHDAARSPAGFTPEGSVASIINKQSPAVRSVLKVISATMEDVRPRPFTEKWDERRYADELGFKDPDAAVTIKSALDGQYVASALQERMTTDADHVDDSPLTMREQLSAAFTEHEGAEHD